MIYIFAESVALICQLRDILLLHKLGYHDRITEIVKNPAIPALL